MSFELLPYDLLLPILSPLEETSEAPLSEYPDLSLALVSHRHNSRATTYHLASNPKYKVGTLFRTLAQSPRLASLVERLDLSGFPRVFSQDVTDLEYNILPGLSHCINLISCRWTRDGTLTDDIIRVLQTSPVPPLRELSVNGRSGLFYNGDNLLHFKNLVKLVLIMPDGNTIQHLPDWCQSLRYTLTELTIICKGGTQVNDALLRKMASHLVHLKLFSITNCSNVTQDSIIPVLRSSAENGGLVSLTLDSVSTLFGWSRFTEKVKEECFFRNLSALTLTRPLLGWASTGIVQLISVVHLRELNLNDTGIYRSQNSNSIRESKELIDTVIKTHRTTLETLGLLRMHIRDDTLAAICSGLPRLRRFFFTQSGSSAMDIRSIPLTRLQFLEYFHISFMSDDSEPFPGVPNEADVVNLVEQCSPNLRQCGFDTRVWTINRKFVKSADGEWFRHITLGPYDRNEIPEAFLVVRA